MHREFTLNFTSNNYKNIPCFYVLIVSDIPTSLCT